MVSIIERIIYLRKIFSSQKVKGFFNFIYERELYTIWDNLADEDFFRYINAIQTDNKEDFLSRYTNIKRREPTSEAPYVNDDYLLFVLICGVVKFGQEKEWLNKVLDCRKCSDTESGQIVATFKNILESDFENKENVGTVILVFQHLLNLPLLNNQSLKSIYSFFTKSEFPIYRADFLNLFAIRAFDIIVEEKEYYPDLKRFENEFTKRAKIIATISYYLSVISIFVIVFYFYKENQRVKEFLDSTATIFGALGLGGLIAFFAKDKVVNIIQKIIFKIFGYKKCNK